MSYIVNTQPSIVKLCHQSGMAAGMHAASPDTLIVYRKVWDDWKHWIYGYDNLAQSAWDFIEWLWPELEEIEAALGGAPFVVEGLNETIATGALEDIERVAEFERQFAFQLDFDTPFHAVPCVLNTAVGNPQHGDETEMLIPAVRAAVEIGGFVGYHAYWPTTQSQSWLSSDWRHYAGRWATSWDETFRAHGLRPHYLLTEGGPIGGPNPPTQLSAGAGWRAAECNNGDWNRTLNQVLRFDQLAHQSIPGQEGRYHGIVLFTVGGGKRWEYFSFTAPEFDSLAAALNG